MTLMIIGQAPGARTDPRMPLYPVPRTSAGGRLAALMPISRYRYVREVERINLISHFPGRSTSGSGDAFPVVSARLAAEELRPTLQGRRVVALGRSVARALGHASLRWHEWVHDKSHDFHIAVAPHTSGLNRWYNDEANVREAQEFWAGAVAFLQ